MKTKLILKGVLLWITAFVAMLWLCNIDSIVEQGYFIPWTSVMAILIYACYKCISYRELYVLSLNRWFNNLIRR